MKTIKEKRGKDEKKEKAKKVWEDKKNMTPSDRGNRERERERGRDESVWERERGKERGRQERKEERKCGSKLT
jgi:hypothetical protein